MKLYFIIFYFNIILIISNFNSDNQDQNVAPSTISTTIPDKVESKLNLEFKNENYEKEENELFKNYKINEEKNKNIFQLDSVIDNINILAFGVGLSSVIGSIAYDNYKKIIQKQFNQIPSKIPLKNEFPNIEKNKYISRKNQAYLKQKVIPIDPPQINPSSEKNLNSLMKKFNNIYKKNSYLRSNYNWKNPDIEFIKKQIEKDIKFNEKQEQENSKKNSNNKDNKSKNLSPKNDIPIKEKRTFSEWLEKIKEKYNIKNEKEISFKKIPKRLILFLIAIGFITYKAGKYFFSDQILNKDNLHKLNEQFNNEFNNENINIINNNNNYNNDNNDLKEIDIAKRNLLYGISALGLGLLTKDFYEQNKSIYNYVKSLPNRMKNQIKKIWKTR